jgi:glycosyltransferase involved in cell wall biosynthesis
MKVGILSTYYGEAMGGADVSTQLFVKELVSRGVDVSVLTTSMTKGTKKLKFFRFLPISVVAFLLNTNVFDWYLEKQIFDFVKKGAFDVVHIQDITLVPAAVKVCKKLGVKSVVTVRDYRFVCNLPICQENGKLCYNCSDKQYMKCLKRYSKRLYGFSGLAYLLYPFIRGRADNFLAGLKKCDHVVAVSKYVASVLGNVGVHSSVSYNCLPSMKEKVATDKFCIVLGVATLAKFKGAEYGLRAVKYAIEKEADIELYLSGDGPEKNKLVRLVSRWGLADRIRLIGKVPYSVMSELYSKSSLVIMSSLWPEPLSRTIYDAFVYGVPVVGFDVGGTSEMVVNGKSGFVVPVRDYVAMGKRIVELYSDKKLYTGMCEYIKKFVKGHNEREVEKYLRLYEE